MAFSWRTGVGGLAVLGMVALAGNAQAGQFQGVEVDPPGADSWEVREVGRVDERARPRPLDAQDPWSETTVDAAPSSSPPPAAPTKRRVRPPIDASDPWTPIPDSAIPLPPPGPAATDADDALRQAIKAAVDAGDLDRASRLIEMLRARRTR